LRQGYLQLETLWKTQNPWFRLLTTIVFGMTVTDAFLLAKYKAVNHPLVKMSIVKFAASVAEDLVKMDFLTTTTNGVGFLPQLNPDEHVGYTGLDSSTSQGTTFSFGTNVSVMYKDIPMSGLVQTVSVPDGAPMVPHLDLLRHPRATHPPGNFETGRAKRKNCFDCGCQSQYFCVQCMKTYCSREATRKKPDGKHCFYAHICKAHEQSGSATKKFKLDFEKWESERKIK
jgi:hypothetical protein